MALQRNNAVNLYNTQSISASGLSNPFTQARSFKKLLLQSSGSPLAITKDEFEIPEEGNNSNRSSSLRKSARSFKSPKKYNVSPRNVQLGTSPKIGKITYPIYNNKTKKPVYQTIQQSSSQSPTFKNGSELLPQIGNNHDQV